MTRSMPTVIGLGHIARTGKDAVADMLVRKYGFEKQGFTDAMNGFIMATHPEIADIVDGRGWEIAKDMFPIVRETQQRVGEAGRRYIDPDVWVAAIQKRWHAHGRYVIKNVRYPNEAQAILDVGGAVYRVDRPGYVPINDHISERALADYAKWTGIIDNSAGLEHLEMLADKLMVEHGISEI